MITELTGRRTSCHTRYHLGQDGVGFVDSARRRSKAFDAAVILANATGKTVSVFDTMARIGSGQLWEIHPGLAEGSRLVLPPVARRGAR